MNNNSNYNRIESYLLQQMTTTERKAFEAELTTDEQLAKQLEQQMLEHKMMEALIEKDLKEDLKKWQEETNNPLPTDKNIPKKIFIIRPQFLLGIFISLLLLVIIFYYFNSQDKPEPPFIQDQKKIENPEKNKKTPKEKEIANDLYKGEQPTNEEEKSEVKKNNNKKIKQAPPVVQEKPSPPNYIALANSYYEPNSYKINTTRGDGSLLDQVNSKLLVLDSLISLDSYKHLDSLKDLNAPISPDNLNVLDSLITSNYAFSEKSLNEIITTDTLNSKIHHHLGLVYYNQKKFMKAIPHFKTIINSEKVYLYIENIQWLLSLSYLQTQENKAGVKTLTQIKNDVGHSFRLNAIELLKKIEDNDSK